MAVDVMMFKEETAVVMTTVVAGHLEDYSAEMAAVVDAETMEYYFS